MEATHNLDKVLWVNLSQRIGKLEAEHLNRKRRGPFVAGVTVNDVSEEETLSQKKKTFSELFQIH